MDVTHLRAAVLPPLDGPVLQVLAAATRSWPVVEALLRLPQALVAALRQELYGWTVPAPTAALVGTEASGSGDVSSDIDVLLVRGAQPLSAKDQESWRRQLGRLRER